MSVLLYRPSLDFASGAGQLIAMQLIALRAAGEPTEIGCARGALKFWRRSGIRARRLTVEAVRARRSNAIVVDHGSCLPEADVVFVHNVVSEAARHLGVAHANQALAEERAFFRGLRADVPVVANSRLVKNALVAHFGIPADQVVVHYPGFQARRFNPSTVAELRAPARHALGIEAGDPLVGMITSGDFEKRGLDIFLDCAQRITAARPRTRFLVVGSKALPALGRAHPLAVSGRLVHRPKGPAPERWFAALDLLLYPARFEEFGMVVAEAQACAVPIVTSRVVGAAECLAPGYDAWLADRPDPEPLAARALALLEDGSGAREMAFAAAEHARAFDDAAYKRACVATILSRKPKDRAK